jgi:hypothetical protein
MDVRPPLREHVALIIALREFIYGTGTLDPATVRRDDTCSLGRWLDAKAAGLHHFPEFDTARQAHTRFHAEAERIVHLVVSGRRHDAAAAMEHGGRLRNQSADLVRAFMRLSHRLAAAHVSPAQKASHAAG